jgi:addiction module HigA family antidote
MGNLGYGFRPVHPGELLKDEIEYRGIPQRKLAEQMGVSPTILNDILNCRRPLSTNMAMLFEAALDISAGLTMRMQLKYNMQVAQKNKIFVKRLNEIRKVVAVL